MMAGSLRVILMGFAALMAGMSLFGLALAQQTNAQQAEVPASGLAETFQQGDDLGVDAELGPDDILSSELPEIRYEQFSQATLRALDKITGRSTDIEIVVGRPIVFGSLKVALKTCYQTPPELPPEAAAFLEVEGVQAVQAQSAAETQTVENGSAGADDNQLFSGWMFASSPGLSALEHPVYDIWVIRCKAALPVVGASGE